MSIFCFFTGDKCLTLASQSSAETMALAFISVCIAAIAIYMGIRGFGEIIENAKGHGRR